MPEDPFEGLDPAATCDAAEALVIDVDGFQPLYLRRCGVLPHDRNRFRNRHPGVRTETLSVPPAIPDLMRMIEAILFASPKPLNSRELAEHLPQGAGIPEALARLRGHYVVCRPRGGTGLGRAGPSGPRPTSAISCTAR